MAKNKTDNNKSCDANPKDSKPTHTCEHGRSVPNRPGPVAEQYKRQTGHY
jgi:hypothetical protein